VWDEEQAKKYRWKHEWCIDLLYFTINQVGHNKECHNPHVLLVAVN